MACRRKAMFRVGSYRVALSVLVIAAFSSGCSNSSSPPSPSLGLSPSAPQAIDVGQTIAITATNAPNQGVLWALNGPGALSNATGLSVTYTAPASGLGSAQQATVTATSQANMSQKASLQITVSLSPQIPFQTLPGGSAGTPYSQTIALNGGTPPFQWSVYNGPIDTGFKVGGSVPDGLTLDAATGRISGTPTAGGTWFFEATVTDAAGVTAINGFLSIQVNASVPMENPIPFLNQPLSPAAVSPGGPGFTLSVSGAGFVSGATVDLNGVPLPTTLVDSDHLTATVSAAGVATAGTASVTVVNPAPGGGRSNPVYLQLGAPETVVNFVNAPGSPLAISEPFALAAADFNEDGKQDLAIASDVRVFTLLGHGDGTFAPAPGSPLLVPSPPYDDLATPLAGPITVGDFDHSGHLGLAV